MSRTGPAPPCPPQTCLIGGAPELCLHNPGALPNGVGRFTLRCERTQQLSCCCPKVATWAPWLSPECMSNGSTLFTTKRSIWGWVKDLSESLESHQCVVNSSKTHPPTSPFPTTWIGKENDSHLPSESLCANSYYGCDVSLANASGPGAR